MSLTLPQVPQFLAGQALDARAIQTAYQYLSKLNRTLFGDFVGPVKIDGLEIKGGINDNQDIIATMSDGLAHVVEVLDQGEPSTPETRYLPTALRTRQWVERSLILTRATFAIVGLHADGNDDRLASMIYTSGDVMGASDPILTGVVPLAWIATDFGQTTAVLPMAPEVPWRERQISGSSQETIADTTVWIPIADTRLAVLVPPDPADPTKPAVDFIVTVEADVQVSGGARLFNLFTNAALYFTLLDNRIPITWRGQPIVGIDFSESVLFGTRRSGQGQDQLIWHGHWTPSIGVHILEVGAKAANSQVVDMTLSIQPRLGDVKNETDL